MVVVVQASWLAVATTIFFVWALLAWIVRGWAKLRTRAWTLDDYAISGSMLASFLHMVFVFLAISHGYGKPLNRSSAAQFTQVEIALYLAHIFYIVSSSLCRVSSASFIAYIAHTKYAKPAHALAIVAAVWAVASSLAVGIRGNLTRPWEIRDGSSNMFIRWLVIEITGILIELALWVTAARLTWGIQTKLLERVLILSALSARLLIIPLIILRLVYLNPRMNDGMAAGATMADLLTEACLYFSIMASSSTALRPLLRSFYATHPGATGLRTASTGGSSKRSRDAGFTHELPGVHAGTVEQPAAVLQNYSRKVVIGRTGVGDITWQSAQGSRGVGVGGGGGGGGSGLIGTHQVSAYSKPDKSRNTRNSRNERSGNERRDMQTGRLKRSCDRGRDGYGDYGPIVIEKTMEFTVVYR